MAQTGYSKVQIYSSSTATHTPSAGNLTNDTNGSELAINITDGKLFYKDNSGTVQVLATKGSGVVGGSNTQVQYNSSGTFAGSANLTFDGATLTSSGFSGPLNGSVGATTANTGAFTTLSASSTVSGTGFSTYLASPPAIGGTAAAAGSFTTVTAGTSVTTPFVTSAAATNLLLKSAGTTAITIDTSQNVGVGVTPSAWNSSYRAFQFAARGVLANDSTDAGVISFGSNYYRDSGTNYVYLNSSFATRYTQYAGQHQWYTAASGTAGSAITFTQAMTLDASGNLLVGTTSTFSGIGGLISAQFAGFSNNGITLKTTYASTGSNFAVFLNSAGNVAGEIQQNGTTTVSYLTASDYRLKENVVPMTGALATVAQLKPVTYDWISDKSKGQGFIAHELQAVVPDCVSGEKDAVDSEGKPVYQGIDTSFLVATLTSAIQELSAQVTTLQTQVTALKG